MHSLADRSELVGFFSYSREDDTDSMGALSTLRDRIQRELRGQLGRSARDFRLWQDREAIAPGSLWETEIQAAISQSVFFIPIITPTSVRSTYCRFEFEAFLSREQELGRSDLIFPLLYIRVPALEKSTLSKADPVLSMIVPRQYVDWREFRHRDVYSTPVGEAIERLCSKIVEALARPDSGEAEREQRWREESERHHRREEQEQRPVIPSQADEAARLAEEERRAEEAARLAEEEHRAEEAARLAEEERRAEEAARLAAEKRQAEEAARLVAAKRQAEEAARLVAAKRQTGEAARRRQDTEQEPATQTGEGSNLEHRTLAKISVRLVPLLIVCYSVIYLERTSLNFALATMRADVGLSILALRSGAYMFLLAYLLCMVPSSLAMVRFGARRWIALLMLTSGIVAGATAFMQGEAGFYLVRVLLGVAQAGFVPGIIFYLTLWVPAAYRARTFAYVLAAAPLSVVIGPPLSVMLMGLDGTAGIKGWQWLFILTAIPAIVLAGVTFRYHTDIPGDAFWLAPAERDWLDLRLRAEHAQRQAVLQIGVRQTFANPKVLILSVVFFGVNAMSSGMGFSVSLIVRAFGGSNAQIGFLTPIPYVVGMIGMVWYGRRSALHDLRKGRVAMAMAMAIGAIGLAGSTLPADPVLRLILLSVGAAGIFAVQPVFWTLTTAFLSGASAAAGIAEIFALGGVGSLIPYVIWPTSGPIGSFTPGPLLAAGFGLIAIVVAPLLRHDPARLRPPPD